MGRRRTLKRLAIGIPFLIAYVFVLFPAILLLAIVFGVIDALWRLLTGEGTQLTNISAKLWDWNGSNARWALTGRGEFELLP